MGRLSVGVDGFRRSIARLRHYHIDVGNMRGVQLFYWLYWRLYRIRPQRVVCDYRKRVNRCGLWMGNVRRRKRAQSIRISALVPVWVEVISPAIAGNVLRLCAVRRFGRMKALYLSLQPSMKIKTNSRFAPLMINANSRRIIAVSRSKLFYQRFQRIRMPLLLQ